MHGQLQLTASLAISTLLAFAGCNQPPEGHAVSLEPAEPSTVDALRVVLTQDAIDPNGDPLTYTYAWYRDGALVTEITEDTVPPERTLKGETWSVNVQVDDGRKASLGIATATTTILNTPPTARLDFEEDRVGTEVDIVARVDTEDLDEDDVSLDIAWRRDGTSVAHSSLTLPAAMTSKGEIWELTITPNDGEDDGEPQTLAARIANTPPVAAGARLTPTELFEASEVRCTSEGWTDPDGDRPDYRLQWFVNDVEVIGPGEVLDGTWFDKGDTVSCALTPWDGESDGETVRSASATVLNTLPEIRSARTDPASPKTVDDVLAVVDESFDADGDAIEVDVQWIVNGRVTSRVPTLSASQTSRGAQLRAELTPSDDEGRGPTYTIGPITVANTPPVVRSVSLSPTTVRTNDALTAVVSGSDADGDRISYTYAWTVDGRVVPYTGFRLDGGSWFDKGDVVSVAVTPTDGRDSGSPVSSRSLTVLNTPPTAPAVRISPTAPTTSDALRCVVTTPSADPDADVIRYTATWTRDGSAISGTTTSFSGDTINASSTSGGQTWVCRVTGSDGTVSSPAGTASVKVIEWTGKRTFTTCGATGQSGPSSSQCLTAYTRTTLAGEVSVTGGKQRWTVPVSGTYTIEAWGAQGASAQSGRVGGRGARMRGNFYLTKGTVLDLIVGQAGTSDGCSGGGGGGSFVARGTTRLLIAGGGGGTRNVVSQNGCAGRTSSTAGTGSGSGSTWGCGSKATSTIAAGGIVSATTWGSGGGAWSTDGAYEYSADNRGRSFTSGGRGGGTTSYKAYGGFGGGGAGNGSCGGGGGGGYSGGDGGRLAGGAGSYNGGSAQSNTSGARSGQGMITIDLN